MAGSQSIAVNDFRLEVNGAIPGDAGLFYYGPHQAQTPFGDGFRCVGGATQRLNPPIVCDPSGFATRQVDFTTTPAGSGPLAILPNSTWNFQSWCRDPAGPGGSRFNLNDGLQVTFCP